MSSKITIIGAGSVGSTIAYNLSNNNIASEIVLIDINKEKVEGEVMDIVQGTCFRDPISVVAGDYEDAKDIRHRHHHFRNRQKTWPDPNPS